MDVSILQLLYYDRTDAFERINVNKTNKSKQVIFGTIGFCYIKVLSFNQMPAIDVRIY